MNVWPVVSPAGQTLAPLVVFFSPCLRLDLVLLGVSRGERLFACLEGDRFANWPPSIQAVTCDDERFVPKICRRDNSRHGNLVAS